MLMTFITGRATMFPKSAMKNSQNWNKALSLTTTL
jgi:hypothetical protein